MRKLTRLLTIILFILITMDNIYGQNYKSRNTIYGEFLGTSGSTLSLNYDRIIFESNKMFIDLTAGFGYFPSIDNFDPIVGIPISINITTGVNKLHFEFGFGMTYNAGLIQEGISLGDYSEVSSLKAIYTTVRIGFKYQKPNGGIFLRAGLTPMYRIKTIEELNNVTVSRLMPLLGVGVGYSF